MDVWISLFSSLVTGGLALLGVIYTSRKQHDVTISEVKTEIALVKKDITTLEASVSKHNGVVERMFAAEKAIGLLDERLKTANHRISDLEEVNKHED
nr:MAG TPA: hypothetical protein [Caudoviricetes sp.]